jgi:hypothetical protein
LSVLHFFTRRRYAFNGSSGDLSGFAGAEVDTDGNGLLNGLVRGN